MGNNTPPSSGSFYPGRVGTAGRRHRGIRMFLALKSCQFRFRDGARDDRMRASARGRRQGARKRKLAMRLKIEIDPSGLRSMQRVLGRLSDGSWRKEVGRGVIDAGRRTKTATSKAAAEQMAAKSTQKVGRNVRGAARDEGLAFETFAVKGGERIDEYRGLRVLKPSRKVIGPMAGTVASGVWNSPRTFFRSFAANGGYFQQIEGSSKTLHPALWTFGAKTTQPRDDGGRFGKSNQTYGKIERLYGGSIKKELVKDDSLATFHRVAPAMLVEKVVPRLEKLLRFK